MLIHFHGVGLVRCVAEHKDRASRHSYWLAVAYGSPRGGGGQLAALLLIMEGEGKPFSCFFRDFF